MIILITGMFIVTDAMGHEKKEFLVSHGIDYDTGKTVITSLEHPADLGGVYDPEIGEWVILDE